MARRRKNSPGVDVFANMITTGIVIITWVFVESFKLLEKIVEKIDNKIDLSKKK